MNKTVVVYLLLALAVSILSIASVAISVKATLDLITGRAILINSDIRFMGALLATIGVGIALPLDHSNLVIRVLQAYLYPAAVCIIGSAVGQYFVRSHLVSTDIQTSFMYNFALGGGVIGLLARIWLSRHFADLPRWLYWFDAGRQVVTMVIVIFGLAFWLYAWTAI